MSDRWYIYRDGQQLGPYSAADLREALREGSVDPFDLVSREGSSVRQELVEVDEIFATGTSAHLTGHGQASAAHAATVPPAQDHGRGAAGEVELSMDSGEQQPDLKLAAGEGSLEYRPTYAPKLSGGDDRTQVSADFKAQPRKYSGRGNRPRRKRDPKRFTITDVKGRVLGPLSAGEIQSLFYKGVLEKSVKVMKIGSQAQVPVAKFVAVYSEAKRKKEAAMQGGHPQLRGGMPNSKMMQSMALARQAREMDAPNYIAIAAIVGGIISLIVAVAAVAALVMRDGKQVQPRNDSNAREWIDRSRRARQTRPAPSSASNQRRDDLRRQQLRAKLLREQAARRERDRVDRARREAAQRREAERDADRRRQLLREQRDAARQQALRDRDAAAREAARNAAASRRPPARFSNPAPAPAPAPAAPGLQTGQALSGYSVSYSVAAIQACQGPCVISANSANGPVTLRFFKAAYGDTLIARGGSARISGTVQNSGGVITIILSGVN